MREGVSTRPKGIGRGVSSECGRGRFVVAPRLKYKPDSGSESHFLIVADTASDHPRMPSNRLCPCSSGARQLVVGSGGGQMSWRSLRLGRDVLFGGILDCLPGGRQNGRRPRPSSVLFGSSRVCHGAAPPVALPVLSFDAASVLLLGVPDFALPSARRSTSTATRKATRQEKRMEQAGRRLRPCAGPLCGLPGIINR